MNKMKILTTIEKMKSRFGISGAVLKWIAMISMFIDHYALIFMNHASDSAMYTFLRLGIGRLAFPIFAFFIAEGFVRTRNVKKYTLRLFLLALISEIPFDYAVFGGIYWQYQNIFFTLFTGLLVLWGVRNYEGKSILQFIFIALGLVAAEFLYFDYGAYGITVILFMYLLRKDRIIGGIALIILLFMQGAAPLALIPILLYNGTKGRQPKWLFYSMYPAHLALYYLIKQGFFQ